MTISQLPSTKRPAGRTVPLDLRGLPAPEPMEHILIALDLLKPGETLQVRMDREPHPLFSMLRQIGYRHDGSWDDDGYTLLVGLPQAA